ncbi:hypothetical protein AVEN_238450-1, partial [Araneus ventricosus]
LSGNTWCCVTRTEGLRMEFRAHVDKLVRASNWSKWKRQVELLLRHHDVHELVSGDRVCPVLAEDATPEVTVL